MKRTHDAALEWRPPGRTAAEQLAVESKAKGRYLAVWREETREMMQEATGRTLSLRGTAGANRLAARRYLKKVPEWQRPSQEHWGTIRLHIMQAHHVQRSKSLTNSFSRNRCVLQWDEVTLNHLAWTVIVLNTVHASTELREREVISCAKLSKDDDGAAKTGPNISGEIVSAIKDLDAPVTNMDFCCSDTTAYNSSLNLPRDMGGSGAGKGGVSAHLWAWMHGLGHVLFFMIWCLSHLGSNEVRAVMKAAGACRRNKLVKKKGTRDPTKSDERVLLVELLTDLHHVTCTTEGCGECSALPCVLVSEGRRMSRGVSQTRRGVLFTPYLYCSQSRTFVRLRGSTSWQNPQAARTRGGPTGSIAPSGLRHGQRATRIY